MRDRLLALRHDDRGLTLVELAVSMIAVAVVGSMLIGWFATVTRTDSVHEQEDIGTSTARELENQIARDLRRAMRITAAEVDSLSMWIDLDRDGATSTDELITWRVSDAGMIERVVGGEVATAATDLPLPGTTFYYDSVTLSRISEVTIDFLIPTAAGERHVRSRITLRNV